MLFHSCFSGKLQNEIGNCILVVKYLQDCPLLVTPCSPFFFPLNSLFRVSFAFPYCLYSGFPGGSDGKASTCNAGDLSSIPGLGRSPEEGTGCPLRCSGLENLMELIVHGVAKSWTQLSEFHFTYQCLTYFICCLFTWVYLSSHIIMYTQWGQKYLTLLPLLCLRIVPGYWRQKKKFV